ncbi:hypothetical protein [Micromonospora sp. NBC_01796]|uniref:hypothetical protein n=1 Tax=Micromonospora sp. NBC_01796 TaxID=2975987 RepID=UPI002DDC7109|nr:hypothetical protein [Micromonospora sp. NBC_01796]WSA85754.1 hypothetical protein OIE47_36335 [Micromonospora sp. NBC_01796]
MQFAAIAVAEEVDHHVPVASRTLPLLDAEAKQFSFDRREVGQINLRFHIHRPIMQRLTLARTLFPLVVRSGGRRAVTPGVARPVVSTS